MTTQTEALKLALEALERGETELRWKAITAIKEALNFPNGEAQPEQEPKCGAIIEVFGKDWRLEYMSLPVGKHKLYTQQYTYTTPPQRTAAVGEDTRRAWVGLTDDEIHNMTILMGFNPEWVTEVEMVKSIVRNLEAKLKEKNT